MTKDIEDTKEMEKEMEVFQGLKQVLMRAVRDYPGSDAHLGVTAMLNLIAELFIQSEQVERYNPLFKQFLRKQLVELLALVDNPDAKNYGIYVGMFKNKKGKDT